MVIASLRNKINMILPIGQCNTLKRNAIELGLSAHKSMSRLGVLYFIVLGGYSVPAAGIYTLSPAQYYAHFPCNIWISH